MTDVWLTNLAAHAVQMAPSVILLTLLGAIIAAALLFVAKRYPSDQDEVVEKINACLPQTQCAQCGHPGCRPYAVAIAAGEAINRCPPGGEAAIKQLAQLLGQETVALDSNFGEEQIPKIAKIREQECIGCTLWPSAEPSARPGSSDWYCMGVSPLHYGRHLVSSRWFNNNIWRKVQILCFIVAFPLNGIHITEDFHA